MRHSQRNALTIGIIAAIVLLLDQTTKAWVRVHIPFGGALYPLPFARSFFRLTHLTNTGVAFGFLRDSSFLFVIIAAVILLTILLYVRHLPWERPLIQVAAGLQLGGALGNLFDRVIRGHVTDFLDFYVRWKGKVYHYPPFNVADASIVVGVALLIVCLWREEKRLASSARPIEAPQREERTTWEGMR